MSQGTACLFGHPGKTPFSHFSSSLQIFLKIHSNIGAASLNLCNLEGGQETSLGISYLMLFLSLGMSNNSSKMDKYMI